MANEENRTKLGREDEIQGHYEGELAKQKTRSSEDTTSATAQELSNREASAGVFEDTEGTAADPGLEEDKSGSSWKTDVNPQEAQPTKKNFFKGFMQANRKKGPIAAVLALIVLVAFGIAFITPGLLLIHITETITDRLNMQSASMKVRTNRIYAKKLSNQALSGVCTQKGTIRCKFNSLNERQLKSLRAAGIEIEIDKNTTITGRYKPTKMTIEKNGVKTEINPKNLSIELQKNNELRQAMDKAYSSKFATWADNKAKSVLDNLGLHKQPSTTGALTDEERETKQREYANTKKGEASETGEGRYREATDENGEKTGQWTDGSKDENGSLITVSKETAEAANADAVTDAGTLNKSITEIETSKKKVTGQVLSAAEKALESGNAAEVSKAKGLAGGILGFALTLPDQACNFYGMYKAISYGAKTIRAYQTARYAMDFLSMGSKQKAGDSSPEELAFYADKLTKTVSQETLNEKGEKVYTASKPATDSYGFNYVAYGDTGPLTPSAAEFANGGGLGGKMTGISDAIISKFGGKENINDVCGVIKNPFVQFSVLLVGVAAIAFGGPIGAGTVASLITGAGLGIIGGSALSMAESLLTPILADMAAGVLIDDSVFGEKSGDALVSGAGYIMSNMAGAGGNAPLTPQDAVAYNGVQNQVLAQQAEDERMALSPFDPSSRYTFMGRIVDQLIPYQSQMTTASSFVNTSYSVVTRSLASIFNPSALAQEATVATYTQCDDVDYKELNLATDPFCNPIRGIPPQYLGTDPNTIVDQLITNDDIDEISGAAKSEDYKNFIANCIDRQDPLGYTGDGFDPKKDGHDCFIKDDETASATTKAYWYIYQIDLRVIDGMENGFPDTATCLPTTPTATVSTNQIPSSSPQTSKISESDIKTLITSYNLPAPIADGETGYKKLAENLKSNPDASWASQALLDGERNWTAKGGTVKPYLNTAWLWFEGHQDGGGWPDPYEITCQDSASLSQVSLKCDSTNAQIGGYQSATTAGDYKEIFKKLYSESEFTSIMKSVLSNSSKASVDAWDYTDPGQQSGLVAKFAPTLDSASLNDVDTNRDAVVHDEKTQFLTYMLGKDPGMVTALNSYAVTDDDLVKALKGTAYGYINDTLKQRLSNMVMALHEFDGSGPSSSTACKTSGSQPSGSGEGIAAIFNGTVPDVSQEFGPTDFSRGEGASMYTYATEYGMNPPGHTGVDYGVELDTKIYTPVAGTVITAGGTCYFQSDDRRIPNKDLPEEDRCNSGGLSLPGTGELKIKLTNGDELILGHLHQIEVKVGDQISPGQYVGLSGTSGSGPHVHVEYRIPDTEENQTPSGQILVDPRKYL